jgi:hypothetical protein
MWRQSCTLRQLTHAGCGDAQEKPRTTIDQINGVSSIRSRVGITSLWKEENVMGKKSSFLTMGLREAVRTRVD